MDFENFKKLSGDASSRKFYRNKKNNSIIVFCNKEKFKNLVVYDAINKLLKKNRINSPNLISENYNKNYIEISDLGDVSGLKIANKFKIKNYFEFFKILKKLQKIKQKKIKTFLNHSYKIPSYSDNLLINESKLFSEWYLPTKIKKNKKIVKKKFNLILKNLIKGIKNKDKVLVHRDFHVSNIMYFNKNFFLIDNQDAVFGNKVYDLASLIDDVRIKISLKNREKLYKAYVKKTKQKNKYVLRNDFEILSILRNLKIIGIFTRLSQRDKKHSYLKMIPYAWKMIDDRRKTNSKAKELNVFIDKYFPKKIRMKG
tara:strand:- start:1455 stop:2393 length:939 start_codon:yes stop_codon:yes gene_type:complete